MDGEKGGGACHISQRHIYYYLHTEKVSNQINKKNILPNFKEILL